MNDRRHVRRAGAVWAVAAVLAIPAASLAQEEAAPDAGAGEVEMEPAAPVDDGPQGVEAITITGEMLDVTDVQDEAQAITAFGAADLDKMNISNVDGLALNVPGLHVGQQGQNAIITLRGVGTENASLTGEPGVAFHVDGINYGRPAAARVAFFDVQTIEVRRGPQGLLGGKNSTSGAIHVITNDPSFEYEVQGDVLLGNYDRVRSRGVVNIPLGEELAVRLAAFYEDRDGYLDNTNFSDSRDPFDLDNFGLRGKIRFAPTDSVDIVLGYNYFKETGNGPQADIVPVLNRNPCPGSLFVPAGFTSTMPVQAACRLGGGFGPGGQFLGPIFHDPVPDETDPEKTAADSASAQDDRYWGFSGKVNVDVPEIPLLGLTRLKLIGGYQRTDVRFDWDFDAVDFGFYPLFSESSVGEHTAELQWSGNIAERLDWQSTFFFMRMTGDSHVLSPSRTNPRNLDSLQTVENTSHGAALHGEYRFSENLTFSLGGRWIKDRKRNWLRRETNRFEGCIPRREAQDLPVGVTPEWGRNLDGSPPELPQCDLTDRGTMWGARLEWRPILDLPFFDDQLLYAGIDRGYKSGGWASGGVGTYDPEKIWAYTAGIKSEFFDRRLQVNVEGFFYAYDAMQLALLDGTKIRTENADARMWGWEVELRSEPIPGLRFQGLVSFLDTETRDYFSLDTASLGDPVLGERLFEREFAERIGAEFPGNSLCIGPNFSFPLCADLGARDGLDDFSGNELSRSPRLQWNLSAEYDIPLGGLGTLTPRVQFSWQDKTFYRVFNREFDAQDAFHKTDVKLIWSSPEERWQVEAFVNNVENDYIIQNILVGPRTFGSPPLAWYAEPRFYGVRVGFRY